MEDYDLYPLTPEQIRMREVLIKVAHRKGVISYTDLLRKANITLDMSIPYNRGVIGYHLGEISRYEFYNKRPMLSSVVIHAGGTQQGQGFYELAEDLYETVFNNSDDRLRFGIEELNRTHAYWAEEKL